MEPANRHVLAADPARDLPPAIAEIERRFGFLPPHFAAAAKDPAALRCLWHGALAADLDGSIPELLREKLFARLSRHSSATYSMVAHACRLRDLGLPPEAILRVVEDRPAREDELAAHLAGKTGSLESWPQPGSALEEALIEGAEILFLDAAGAAREELERLLGPTRFAGLVAFLAHVKACHQWTESCPEEARETEERLRERSGAWLRDEPRLDHFLRTGHDRFRRDPRFVGEPPVPVPAAPSADDLRLIEDRFQLISRASNDALWDWDLLEGNVWWNEGVRTLFGYGADAMRTDVQWWEERIHPEDRKRITSGIKALIACGSRFWSEEYRFRRAGGAYAYVLDRGYVIHDPAGKPVRMVGAMIDLTERELVEETLALHAEERAGTRKAEELERSCEELRQSNRRIEEFAYIASHDLREPLRGIHNYASFLIEDYGAKLDGEGRAKLETLKRLALRMDGIIESVLLYSRAGTMPLCPEEVDLNAVLAVVLDALAPAIQEAGVEVRIPRRLPKVACDPRGATEVFRCLTTNALKFNDKAERWVEIGFEAGNGALEKGGAAAGSACVLYVRDNGIGIPERHLETVFRVFKRLHAAGRYGGGTGIGLSLARAIVERHGGRIWVESVPGQGSTFRFTLEGQPVR